MKGESIKIGFCVAYDWQLLEYALPLVYESADTICLSIDKDKISWGRERFTFDETAFHAFISRIDSKKKITILEEDFHQPNLTPMQNEVRQRNRMAEFMGKGGWHIQLDCDEYFLEFEKFVKYLVDLRTGRKRKSNINCALITLFKKIDERFYFVLPTPKSIEFIQIATKEPVYENGRRNGNFNIYTNFTILHQSWARNEDEVKNKLKNWGHKTDFDTEIYFNKWKSLNTNNFHEYKNFHPIQPDVWPSLGFTNARNELDLIHNPPSIDFPYSKWDLLFKNSRSIGRLRSLFRK